MNIIQYIFGIVPKEDKIPMQKVSKRQTSKPIIIGGSNTISGDISEIPANLRYIIMKGENK